MDRQIVGLDCEAALEMLLPWLARLILPVFVTSGTLAPLSTHSIGSNYSHWSISYYLFLSIPEHFHSLRPLTRYHSALHDSINFTLVLSSNEPPCGASDLI
jgi:hypothetical protein